MCVKLEHDPATHSWRTNASVTTTTPGMVLHRPTVYLERGADVVATGSKPPARSQILGIVTGWYKCNGQVSLVGREYGSVTWPDGSDSPNIATDTPTVTGTC